jgi:hypothetical protein
VVRRRSQRDEAPVDLGAAEHAWWAGSTTDPPPADEPPGGPAGADVDADPDDPSVVLRVTPTATWDEIVASYRRLARWWHPDGLVDPAPGERELCDDMIRRLNIAYAELRVRRGR